MNCLVCTSNVSHYYKTIEGVPITVCNQCLCGFVDSRTPRKKTDEIYSFVDYKKREAQFILRYKKTVNLINFYTQGKRILEIGAGFGLLSSMLCKAKYDVTALEPDVVPEYLKGLPVKIHKQYLNEFNSRNRDLFDVVIMYDVIEHSDNPKLTIATLKSLLNKNGIVVIQTPNYRSLMAYLVQKWSWWMVEDHRFFFSQKSLSFLFPTDMWKREYYETYEDWEDFKKNLDGNFKNRMAKRLFFILFIPLYFLFRKILWKGGYGGLHLGIWRLK